MSKSITLTIDGLQVSVPEGTTLYWAAKKLGIEIPHLCYGEDLPAMSSCRVCVVEVEGMRNLAASCSHPAGNGMVVHTDSERVQRARKLNLELILSDHTVDCITCEKSGTCLLEKYAYEFGIKGPSFEGVRNEQEIIDDDPFIIRDYNKCILCGRCVYVCNEIQYDHAINIADRGFPATIGTSFDRTLQDTTCVSCGRCISVCPTGALSNRKGGGVVVKKKLCIRCGDCADACPVSAIHLDSTGEPFLCIHCGRCVSFCPHDCLEMTTILTDNPTDSNSSSQEHLSTG